MEVSSMTATTSSSLYEENERLIPSLPYDILIEILARLPRSCYLNLTLVCRSWKDAILSRELYKVRKELGNMDEWLYILTRNKDGYLTCYGLDPQSRQWYRVPRMPFVFGEGEPTVVSAEKIKDDPFHGFGVGAVNGCIYVLGGFYNGNAVKRVWCYNPILNSWSEVGPMSVGRAYCHTSILDGKLYVVGGLTKRRGTYPEKKCREKLAALHSSEVFDPSTGLWASTPAMPFSKISRSYSPIEDLHPFRYQATGLAAYNGKLYVPQSFICKRFNLCKPEKSSLIEMEIGRGNTQSKDRLLPGSSEIGSAVDIGGDVYDPQTNSWVEMKHGMGYEWPTKRAGARSNVVLNGKLHGISPTSKPDCGRIRIYDDKADKWMRVHGRLHLEKFANSLSPCLLSAVLGELHVVTKDENDNIIIMQGEKRALQSTSHHTSAAVSEYMYVWKVIASKAVGSEELVSCQVLDI